MYHISKTKEQISFHRPGRISSFWSWLFYAWNTLDVNEAGDQVQHTGVRIAGCRYDLWKVTPKPGLDKALNLIFELAFLDGQKRTVEAPSFSSAKVIAAYKRHFEESALSHTQLTVDDKKCRRIGCRHE